MVFRDMKLYLPVIFTLFVFFTSVYALPVKPKHARSLTSELDLRFGEDSDGFAVTRFESPYLQLPIFQHSRIPLLDKRQFSPKRGSGREQLPEETRKVLIPSRKLSSRRRAGPRGVHVVCQMEKMVVKVSKEILGPDGDQSKLKLGTCDISKTTKQYHVFIYDMENCASERKLINHRVTYSNTLRYSPVTEPGMIVRVVPFAIPVECHFNRYYYSYKIGYIPQVRYQHHFKPLRTVDSVVLTARDELWRRLSHAEEYIIGHPMYFQADGPPLAEDERLFVDSCYVTIGRSHLSTPRFTVIENHGCMTDSKSNRWSKFIESGQKNVVRFAVDAFLFHGKLGKNLYMHCEISVGSVNPSASAKSCNYNQETNRWEELYSSSEVCVCCDSTCLSSDLPVSSKVISSDPWVMQTDLDIKGKQAAQFMPEEVGTGFVQVLTTPQTEPGPRHFVPVPSVVHEEKHKFVEHRRTFEEVFGLD